VVSTTSRPIYSWERPGTHCPGGWVGPMVDFDGQGRSLPPPALDSQSVQHVASRVTFQIIQNRTKGFDRILPHLHIAGPYLSLSECSLTTLPVSAVELSLRLSSNGCQPVLHSRRYRLFRLIEHFYCCVETLHVWIENDHRQAFFYKILKFKVKYF